MRMIHTVHPGPDGTVHVQNEVFIGLSVVRGQYHVHSLKGYQNWLNRAEISRDNVITVIGMCTCGLKAGDTRVEVMDSVDAMDGSWIKDGKQSRWEFEVDMIEYRIKDERWFIESRPVMEWWLQRPADVRERLIPESADTAKWRAMDRDVKVAKVREVMKKDE